MAKKRKHDAKAAATAAAESTEPPQKLQHQEEEAEPEQQKQELVEEEYEQEVEEIEEEVEEEDADGDEVTGDQEIKDDNDGDDEDDDDDPIEKLLEPFGKEQILNLLKEASDKHADVADRIRKIADADPAHRKIFVHGLGWDATEETLINSFKQFGEIEDCKAVCDKVTGKCKGYGFILFKKRNGARKALVEPQKKIGNRITSAQLASTGPVPGAGAPSGQSGFQPQVSEFTQRKIYVSNVGADLDPNALMSFFAKFGEIEEGPLGLDKVTGKPKGFCLFVYKSSESARRALEEPHKNFEGHVLHCQKAVDGPRHGKSQHQPQHHHHNSQKSHYNRNGNPGGYNAPGPAHLMAPSARPGFGFNQGAAGAAALNPALGQALSALLASQGAGLNLNLLGNLGSAAGVNQGGVPGAATGIQSGYGTQASPGVIGFGNQGMMQGGYSSQQVGQGGSGRGQHGVGQYGGGGPYIESFDSKASGIQKIMGLGIGIFHVTEALAQSVTARVVTLTECVKQNGLLGLAHGLECASRNLLYNQLLGHYVILLSQELTAQIQLVLKLVLNCQCSPTEKLGVCSQREAVRQGITLLLAKSLLLFFDYGRPLYSEYAVGFSGVLFAMKVVLNSQSDNYTYVHGLMVPARHAAWAELLLVQMFVPGVSFLGHLGGILAGILYLKLKRTYSGSDPLTRIINNLAGALSWPLRFVKGLFRIRQRRISGRGAVGGSQGGRTLTMAWRCRACTYDNFSWLSVCEMCGSGRGGGLPSDQVPHQFDDLSVEEIRRRRIQRFG